MWHLHDAVEKTNYEELRPYFFPYHRYLFGHKPVAAFIISATSVEALKTALEYLNYCTLFVMLFLAVRGLMVDNRGLMVDKLLQAGNGDYRDNGPFFIATGIMALFFLLFYGLDYYVRSISHSMSDLTVFIFLLVAFRVNMLTVSDSMFIILMSGFGVLTAFFELLNGSTPIGAALIILAIGMRASSIEDCRKAIARIAGGLVLFLGSLIVILIFKQLLAAIVFPQDDVIGSFTSQLLLRMTGPVHNHEFSTLDMYNGLFQQISLLAFGSSNLGRALLIGSAILFMFVGSVIAVRGSWVQRYYLIVILLSNIVLAVWLQLFAQHATQHPMYMVRVLVVTMASGWMVASVLLQRAGTRGEQVTVADNPVPSRLTFS
jgi:hypothetical protein